MKQLNEAIIGGELREKPSLFEVSKYFVDKLGNTKHWDKSGVWNGGEKIRYEGDEITIELAKKTAAEGLTSILRSEKDPSEKICRDFRRFTDNYFEAGNLDKLHKLVMFARSGSVMRVQQEMSAVYTKIEQAFLAMKRDKEYRGKTIKQVDAEIRGKINRARRNAG